MASKTINLFGETASFPAYRKRYWGTANCKKCGKSFRLPRPGGYQHKRGKVQEFCSNRCRWDFEAKPKKERPPKPIAMCSRCGLNPARSLCAICKKELRKEQSASRRCQLCDAVVGRRRSVCDKCQKRKQRQREKELGTRRRKHIHRARKHGVEYQFISPIRVFERDNWHCQICGIRTPKKLRGKNKPNSPELDHRIPFALGGTHTWDNVQCSCKKCNTNKSGAHVRGQTNMFSNPLITNKKWRGVSSTNSRELL